MSGKEGELTFFQLVCPPERENEVRTLFAEKQLGSLNLETHKGTRVLQSQVDGEIFAIAGVVIEGIGRVDKQDQILHELADREIAGYSRETQILRSATETIVWKQE